MKLLNLKQKMGLREKRKLITAVCMVFFGLVLIGIDTCLEKMLSRKKDNS